MPACNGSVAWLWCGAKGGVAGLGSCGSSCQEIQRGGERDMHGTDSGSGVGSAASFRIFDAWRAAPCLRGSTPLSRGFWSAPRGAWNRALQCSLLAAVGLLLPAIAGAGPGDDARVISAVYRFEAPQLESRGNLTRLVVPGCGQLNRLGEPAMPFRTARLLLPPGSMVTQAVVVAASSPTTLTVHGRIEYAGQPHEHPAVKRNPFALDENRAIYASDAAYPSPAAELISVQCMAGCDIALVRLFPVQYKPASSQVLFTAEMTLQLSLVPVAAEQAPRVRPPTLAQASRRVADFVDNPALIQSVAAAPTAGAAAPASGFDYLLITSSNLAAAFQPLVERKTQDGLAVKVAMLEAITNTISGRDVPEQIRNYIRQAYTNWGISYVLLGGGTTVIPCRYAYVHTDQAARDSYLPTDLYYACLDGSWNGNGDRHWGEATDGDDGGDVDLLAEVYVGRAPVATVAQVQTFVEKTTRCETAASPNATNALLMATFLGDFPTGSCQGGDMYQPLRPMLAGFHVDALDDAPQKLPQWGRNEALAALNRAPHVVLYNGHGSADILMRLHPPDVARLTNPWPFLLCSVGCSAAEFDHGKFWPDSIGEALVNAGPHGAFAAVLNARAGWFDPQYPWKYSGEFQTQLFTELLQRGHVNLGQANQHSKEELVGQVERKGPMTYRWCYYGITLLGDPHLPFHAPPRSMP